MKSSFKAVLKIKKPHNAFSSIIQIQNVFKFPPFVGFEIDSAIIRDNKKKKGINKIQIQGPSQKSGVGHRERKKIKGCKSYNLIVD